LLRTAEAPTSVGVRLQACVVASLLFVPSVAHAVDPFEIQVYDGNANDPGAYGLELHVNSVWRGLKDANGPELPQHHATHFTFEPSLGITPWWELGMYLQTALLPDGSLDWAGIKLRTKFVSPPKWSKHTRLGLNFELGLLPERFDRGRWGVEIRPIVAWENDHWLLALNPIVDLTLTRPELDDGPSFQPAAMALYQWKDLVSIGFEYYANLGPIADLSPWQKQEQYVYEVVNVLSIEHFELNIGFGQGITDASNPFVAKTILGYTWGEPDKAIARARVPMQIGSRR
jgi:hypothetical protein